MKKRIHQLLNVSEKQGNLSWWFDMFLILLISANVIAVVLESVEPLRKEYQTLFNNFELISVAFFSIEYVLRIWTANEDKKFQKPIIGNIRYSITPMALVDLFAVLPFYLPFIGIDMRFIRMIRLFRLFRILKIARYLKAFKIINNVFREKKDELLISIILTLFLLLFTSTIMYFIENKAQPENFSSIPQTMWWGIATLTTVGYGDIYPVTGIGRLMGGIIALIGIGLFALPTGILASGFSEQLEKNKKAKNECPHCGKNKNSIIIKTPKDEIF
jgi:voltage-gated potassium channel